MDKNKKPINTEILKYWDIKNAKGSPQEKLKMVEIAIVEILGYIENLVEQENIIQYKKIMSKSIVKVKSKEITRRKRKKENVEWEIIFYHALEVGAGLDNQPMTVFFSDELFKQSEKDRQERLN